MSDILFKYNSVTTDITKDIKDELSKEAFSELFEYVNNIPMLQYLIDPERPTAKDRRKDKDNKIIVDITRPHLLEDIDYFRPAAKYFEKHGKYTGLYPNKNPNSAYKKFWDEEIRRCKEGYVRESDGEWITGYNYFYWNYSPIMKTVVTGEYNDDGSVKADRKYTFADAWDGDYLYFHYIDQAINAGKFGTALKTRGRGYSFKAGSMPVRNMLLYQNSKSFAFADDTQYLLEDGLLNKSWDTLDWCNTHTAFGKLLTKNTEEHKRAGYVDKDTGTEKGYRSEVMGVTMKNNPHKARGKRGMLIEWEEAGSFRDLLTSWKIAQKSLEDGNRVFGFMIAFGTGGEPGPGFIGLESLFYESEAYRVFDVRNVWDKNADKSTCAYYVPEYMNRADCYDENGNSDVIKAMIEVVTRHDEIRRSASDPNALAQEKAESSLTPQEAVMRVQGTIFPVADLKDYLAGLAPSMDRFISEHYVGRLTPGGGSNISWIPDADVNIIRKFPHSSIANLEGGVEIYQMPIKGGDGLPMRGRYVIGVDPVDHDSGTSLASSFVFDLFKDKIVAEYTGRPQTANEYYENVLRLSIFYNAEINYENNLKGLFSYFSNRHAVHRLSKVPQILKDMQLIKGATHGNKAVGTPANKFINGWARKLLSDWMISRATEDPEDLTINLQTIRSIGLIEEAIRWNGDINADRVSAMGMVMIIREDKLSKIPQLKNPDADSDYLGNDTFFNNNYEIKLGKITNQNSDTAISE